MIVVDDESELFFNMIVQIVDNGRQELYRAALTGDKAIERGRGIRTEGSKLAAQRRNEMGIELMRILVHRRHLVPTYAHRRLSRPVGKEGRLAVASRGNHKIEPAVDDRIE